MAQANDIELTLRSNPRLLCAVRGLVHAYLEKQGVPAARIHELVLAIDEAVANSMRHAYAGAADQPVRFHARRDGGWIELAVCDDGRPAPAERVARKPMATPDPATVQPGGLGVQLIYSAFDEVRFEPGAERGNRVVMRLRADAAEDTP